MLKHGNNLPLVVNFNSPPPQGGVAGGPTVYQLSQPGGSMPVMIPPPQQSGPVGFF